MNDSILQARSCRAVTTTGVMIAMVGAALLLPVSATAQTPTIYVTPLEQSSAELPFASAPSPLRGGPGTQDVGLPVFETRWNTPTLSGGSIVSGYTLAKDLVGKKAADLADDITDLDGIKFGARGSVHSSGSVAFDLRVGVRNAGDVQVDYPVTVYLSIPTANTFRGGDTVVLRTRHRVGAGARMDTTAMGGDLGVVPTLALNSSLSVEGCVADCFTQGLGVNLPETSLEILTVDSTDVGRIDITFVETFIHGISGYYGFPDTGTNGGHRSGLSLTDQVTHQFTDLNFDIDSYATRVLKAPPLGLNSPTVGGVQFGYQTIDYSFTMQNSLRRRVDFVPDLQLTLTLGAPLKWAVLAAHNDNVVVAQGQGNTITFRPGESLALTLPDGWVTPVPLATDYVLDNQFNHSEAVIHSGSYKNTAGKISAAVPAFTLFGGKTICLFGHLNLELKFVCDVEFTIPRIRFPGVNFDLGPALVAEIPLPPTVDNFLPDVTTTLPFAALTGPGGLLDPEDPIISVTKELSRVVNNGAGSRTVRYTMLVQNDGDVPLTDLSLVDRLTATFPQVDTFDYTVDTAHSCVLDLAGGFDGRGDGQLLTSGQTLQVGEEALVNLQMTVRPKPFPQWYVNGVTAAGTSVPRGTRVDDSGQAEPVNMGPAVITSVDDFVLYATHEVVFDGSGDVRGNVGSGHEIEVEEETDMVIAGDLHTPGEVEIEGVLTTDYIFAGASIEIEPEHNAQLIVTGHAAEQVDVVPFELDEVVVVAGGDDITVTDDMGPTMLAPGSYGHIRVMPGGVLMLADGIYDLTDLTVGPMKHDNDDDGGDDKDNGKDEDRDTPAPPQPARVMFDLSSGPVDVNIAGLLRVGDHALLVRRQGLGSSRDITLSVAGLPMHDDEDGDHGDDGDGADELEIHIGKQAVITGNLIAPTAELIFAEGATLYGSARAYEITLKEGASAWYHIDDLGELFRQVDSDCDGVPDR